MMENNPSADRLARILDEVLGESSHEAETEAARTPPEPSASSPPDAPASASSASPGGGLGALLGGLTADPALLSSLLPTLLSALAGLGGGGQSASATPSVSPVSSPSSPSSPSSLSSPPVSAPAAAATSVAITPRKPTPDRHTALLCAVKPYLGERRQATAETVLRLCRVWDALSRAGITPALLAGLFGGGTPSTGSLPVGGNATSEASTPSDNPAGGV